MITTRHLTKKYDNLVALDDLNLEIGENEVFGLLGSNGAGKTTTIHMLATLLKPTSGSAIVNGFDILKQASKVRSSIGIVFQAPSSDDMLTGYENLKLHSLLYNVPRSLREKRIDEVLNLVGLQDRRNDRVKKYSGGMRRRLEIARGLVHKPKVLFLDEPTLGLDPSSRETMWSYIQNLVKEEKVTIILTTHYMEEADALCDRIAIIDRGKIITMDTPGKLKRMLGDEIVTIDVDVDTDGDGISERKLNDIKSLSFVHSLQYKKNERKMIMSVDDASKAIPLILKYVDALNVEFVKPSLNDVFLHYTGRLVKEEAEGGFMEKYAKYD